MTSLLSWLANVMGRRPRIATLAVLATVVAVIGGGMAVGGTFKDDFTVPGIESQTAQDLLAERFPQQSGTSAAVVFSGDLSAQALAPTLEAIDRQPHVVGVAELQTSEDGKTAFTTVSYDQDATDLGADARERLEAAVAKAPKGVSVAMSGEPIDGAATGGFPIGELAGLLIAVALLVIVLRSARAARNALGTALVGVAAGFGVLLWVASLTDVPGLAPTLGGMLGLGAGIDYALLLTARQQEELRAGREPLEAARRANRSAGESALTAAGIVLVSISGLLVTGIPFVGRAGVAAGLVVLVCAIVCVTLLPARFAKSGEKLLPKRERRGAAKPVKAPWATKRPVFALLAAGLVTAALAAPAAGLQLGQPDDRNLGTDATQRQAYDRLAAGFGAGVNGPLVLAVANPDAAGLKQLEAGLAADREVARLEPAVVNEAGDAAVITVIPKHGPQEEATRELVERIRESVVPASGTRAYVGGRTARYGDEASKIASRIPVFAVTVVGLSLLLLLIAFRSWRISVMSAVFNLASIAAAYGVITLAFQTSTGASLLGVEQQPVVPYVPLFMFAILFGLSTDYNVFLLSRVREEWGRHADHRAAIATACAGTKRIITAAGAIMIAVFMGFATDHDPVIKMTGIGLASAVLVDVTLVRLFMAPAALTLLGNRLWPERRRAGAPVFVRAQ
ncbi:MMPL family transporter [Solirubrobacter sp. CPCC 204708]|uniref:MMPL family transporter n=1 Tax=Solirubrobacter deserti TaxID=2282478 RepID=A0ABT4RD63_9ACTN|nr:MMPL family transporter [Solirubrobacter deserti]MBE2317741.1 MMPL family transporter [Solirubrobacter deserti]MDA0136482.1 MMPL family transporter [Solirubrobacter deserti]